MGSISNETTAYVVVNRGCNGYYLGKDEDFGTPLETARRFASVDAAITYLRERAVRFGTMGSVFGIQKIVRTEQTGETTEKIKGSNLKPEFVLRSRMSGAYLSSPIYLSGWTANLSEARKFFRIADALEILVRNRIGDVDIERIVETTSVTESAVDLS